MNKVVSWSVKRRTTCNHYNEYNVRSKREDKEKKKLSEKHGFFYHKRSVSRNEEPKSPDRLSEQYIPPPVIVPVSLADHLRNQKTKNANSNSDQCSSCY